MVSSFRRSECFQCNAEMIQQTVLAIHELFECGIQIKACHLILIGLTVCKNLEVLHHDQLACAVKIHLHLNLVQQELLERTM